jgi:hypothetical protein
MGYRINKAKKLVDVVGEADLDAIILKVKKIGGKGWTIKTTLPLEFVEDVVKRVTEERETTHQRPIGFRINSESHDSGLVTGLPFCPPTVEE